MNDQSRKGGSPAVKPSDEQAGCACLKVAYAPTHGGTGYVEERWECVLCGSAFIRQARSDLAIQAAEREAFVAGVLADETEETAEAAYDDWRRDRD